LVEGGECRGVSGAGIKSDGGWWCKLVIAGTYVGKVYISGVKFRSGCGGELRQPRMDTNGDEGEWDVQGGRW
jgi:hypothetical protein